MSDKSNGYWFRGRECAFAWKLNKDNEVGQVYCAPGNGGTSAFAINIDCNINNNNEILEQVIKYEIDLVLVGPEAPLANGIAIFENKSYQCFGPDKYSA